MPRPRKFDEAQVLGCAMATFWRLGFDATTYRALEAETGVGVRSLHNAFGEKEALFAQALEIYRGMASAVLDEALGEGTLEALARFLEATAAPTGPEDAVRDKGCLVVNSVFELPEMPERAAAEVEAYRAMFLDRFAAILEDAGVPDVPARAEYLLGTLWGMLSQIRLAGDARAAAPMARIAAETVRGWARD